MFVEYPVRQRGRMQQDSGGALEVHAFRACRRLRISRRMPLPKTPQPRIQIQAVEPELDCGRYAVKRTVGEPVEVYATVVKDGHDTLAGAVRVKAPGERTWRAGSVPPLCTCPGGAAVLALPPRASAGAGCATGGPPRP